MKSKKQTCVTKMMHTPRLRLIYVMKLVLLTNLKRESDHDQQLGHG